MSAIYEAGAAVSSPKEPLPLDPIPQTLQELLQQRERWSPTPKSYFDAGYESNASRSPSPSPAKRRRVGRDVRGSEQKGAIRQAGRDIKAGGSMTWGLEEEIASDSALRARRPSKGEVATQRMDVEQDDSASYEMENDPTKMVTTGETQSNEEPDMMVEDADTSPPLLDNVLGGMDDPFTTLKTLLKSQTQETSTSTKTASTASSLPAHVVGTRRLAIPLSPKQVNVPDQRPNRSFLRDEIKMQSLADGEENGAKVKELPQVESKSRVTSVTKPKAVATPDVFAGGVEKVSEHKLATSTTKPLGKSVSANSVRATFVKPALPIHSSLRGPVNPSEPLRNSSTKKTANPLTANPSVFYDPAETSKSIKRTACMSLMDSTLSASASRDTSIIGLRKKRRVDEPVIVPSHATVDAGTGRIKEKFKTDQTATKQPQKTDRHQLDDYKKSYTKAFPSFIFLFEIDLDKAQVRQLKDQIRRLGGVSVGHFPNEQLADP